VGMLYGALYDRLLPGRVPTLRTVEDRLFNPMIVPAGFYVTRTAINPAGTACVSALYMWKWACMAVCLEPNLVEALLGASR
jgi:hypothetical protein